MTALVDLEPKALAGTPLDRVDAERVLACSNLISVGMLGETARKARHSERVTYVRVCEVDLSRPADPGEAGEVRIVAAPSAADDAVRLTREASQLAGGVVLTGFSLATLLELVDGDHLALAELSAALKAAGLDAVAAVPVDRLGDVEGAIEAVRAAAEGGLGTPRATVERATFDERLDLIERTARMARETDAFKAFSPLPDVDSRETPSTGYDDVRTVALARLCTTIPSIQVSWPLYGPKLAQVALAYGADDLDGVPAVDTEQLGRRRSPREDIERQIRAAFAEPVERDGRFEPRP